MGSTTPRELQRYVSEIAAHGEDFRTRAPAMAVSRWWTFRGERVRGAGGRSIPGSCPFSTTRRNSPAFSDMRSATLPRGIRRRRTRQVGGQAGLIAPGIFVPAADRLATWARRRLGCCSSKYGRDDELQSDQLAVAVVAARMDPAAVPAFLSTLGRLDEAAGDRRGNTNRLSTHP